MLGEVNYINNNYYYYNSPQQNQGWNQQMPNYSSCRSDTKFPKGNIKEPVRLSWYRVRPSAAKISLYIKKRKETFTFKNKTIQISEKSRHEPRKRTNRSNKNKQMWTESAKMVTAVQGGQDHRLKSPFLTKKDYPAPDSRLDIPKCY